MGSGVGSSDASSAGCPAALIGVNRVGIAAAWWRCRGRAAATAATAGATAATAGAARRMPGCTAAVGVAALATVDICECTGQRPESREQRCVVVRAPERGSAVGPQPMQGATPRLSWVDRSADRRRALCGLFSPPPRRIPSTESLQLCAFLTLQYDLVLSSIDCSSPTPAPSQNPARSRLNLRQSRAATTQGSTESGQHRREGMSLVAKAQAAVQSGLQAAVAAALAAALAPYHAAARWVSLWTGLLLQALSWVGVAPAGYVAQARQVGGKEGAGQKGCALLSHWFAAAG